MKTRRRSPGGAAILGAAAALSAALFLLTGIIRLFAGSAGEMEQAMARFAPPERTGLPAAEYPAMAEHITAYMTGRKDSFQYEVPGADGERVPGFHDYEMAHMEDCRNLIRLDGAVCLICGLMAAVTGALALRRRMEWKAALAGAKRALWVLGMAAVGLALWAAVNFDGLFITFHRVAFRNDLWLLNPRTDLLIRLMPEALFVSLGLRGLAVFAACMAMLAGGVMVPGWRERKRGS